MRSVPEEARIWARLEAESSGAAQAGSLRCCAGGSVGCCATGDAVPACVDDGLRAHEQARAAISRNARERSTPEV
jgi:hypothetical protein